MNIWRIQTPGGYLLARTKGTYEQAFSWAKNHYSLFNLEREVDTGWLKAYNKGQVNTKIDFY